MGTVHCQSSLRFHCLLICLGPYVGHFNYWICYFLHRLRHFGSLLHRKPPNSLFQSLHFPQRSKRMAQQKAKVFVFTSRPSAKGWSPKGRRGKENNLPLKATGGIWTWDLLVYSRIWPQCHSKCEELWKWTVFIQAHMYRQFLSSDRNGCIHFEMFSGLAHLIGSFETSVWLLAVFTSILNSELWYREDCLFWGTSFRSLSMLR